MIFVFYNLPRQIKNLTLEFLKSKILVCPWKNRTFLPTRPEGARNSDENNNSTQKSEEEYKIHIIHVGSTTIPPLTLSLPLSISLIYIYIYIWSHIQTDNSVIKFKPHFGFQGFFFFLFSFPEPPRIGERFSRRKQGSWDVAVVLCGGLLVGASDSVYPTSEEPQPLCRDHGRYSEGDQYAYWQALSPCAAGLFQDPGLHAL